MVLSNLIKYIPRKLGLLKPYTDAKIQESEFECLDSILQSYSQSTIVRQINKARNSYMRSF